jgi:hypothetical protein
MQQKKMDKTFCKDVCVSIAQYVNASIIGLSQINRYWHVVIKYSYGAWQYATLEFCMWTLLTETFSKYENSRLQHLRLYSANGNCFDMSSILSKFSGLRSLRVPSDIQWKIMIENKIVIPQLQSLEIASGLMYESEAVQIAFIFPNLTRLVIDQHVKITQDALQYFSTSLLALKQLFLPRIYGANGSMVDSFDLRCFPLLTDLAVFGTIKMIQTQATSLILRLYDNPLSSCQVIATLGSQILHLNVQFTSNQPQSQTCCEFIQVLQPLYQLRTLKMHNFKTNRVSVLANALGCFPQLRDVQFTGKLRQLGEYDFEVCANNMAQKIPKLQYFHWNGHVKVF